MIDEYEQLLAHRRGVSDDVTLDSAGSSAVPAAVRTQASNLQVDAAIGATSSHAHAAVRPRQIVVKPLASDGGAAHHLSGGAGCESPRES